jgi:hypothetical protein
MNMEQRKKLGMYRAVMDHCYSDRSLLHHFPEFDLALQCFSTVISTITALEIQGRQIIGGQAIPPEQARKAMCALAANIVALIEVYATDAQNETITETINHSYRSLRRCSDKRLLKNCRNVYTVAFKYIVILERYGLLKECIEVLSGSIDMYNAVVPAPKKAGILKEGYRNRQAYLIREAGLILRNRLDALVKCFMVTEREFYTVYHECRQSDKKRMMQAAA